MKENTARIGDRISKTSCQIYYQNNFKLHYEHFYGIMIKQLLSHYPFLIYPSSNSDIAYLYYTGPTFHHP